MTDELETAALTTEPAVGTSVAPIDGARKNGTITPLDKNLPLSAISVAEAFTDFLFLQRPRIRLMRIGKQWKPAKTAFRPKAGTSKSWEARLGERKAMAAMKAREKELKDEKETARQV